MKRTILIITVNFIFITSAFAQSWPMWAGPYGNWVTDTNDNTELIRDFDKAEFLWKSAEETPDAKGTGHAAASPVVYNNKVYLYYCSSAGEDVIIAFNTDDGSKAWKKTYDGAVFFEDTYKSNAPQNLTLAAGEGKIFSTGLANRVYALDAETGKEIWTAPLNGSITKEGNGGSVVYVEGVAVVHDYKGNGSGLVGFDADNGNEIWRIDNAIGEFGTPSIYVEDNKKYLVAGNPEGVIRCIDPANGNIKWSLTGKGHHSHSLTLAGNHMVISDSSYDNSDVRWACYTISSSGANKKWDFPPEIDDFGDSDERPVIYDGHVYLSTNGGQDNSRDHLYCLDLKDGSILNKINLVNTWNSLLQVVNGYILFQPTSAHSYDHSTTTHFIDPDPHKFRVIDTWQPTHNRASGYVVPMARPVVNGKIYFRGEDGIYCYDIEKECHKEQTIDFPEISPKKTTAADFSLSASASSGLPLTYTLEKGPATLSGSTVSLTGDSGVVTITAHQEGDATWCATGYKSRSFAVGNPVPPQPSGLNAETVGATQIRLTWNDPSGMEDYFFVERKDPSTGVWKQAGKVKGNQTSFVDGGLQKGVAYSHRVYGYNGITNSVFSPIATSTTFNKNSDIWLEPECETVPSGWKIVDESSASNGQFVKAEKNPEGQPGPQETISFTFNTGVAGFYNLWVYSLANGGAQDSYKYAMDDSSSWSALGVWGGGTWGWNGGVGGASFYLKPGEHTFYIGIRETGFRLDKVLLTTSERTPSSLEKEAMNCKQGNSPQAPADLKANALSSNQVELTWKDNADNEEVFIIERKTNSGDYSQIGNVIKDITSYTDKSCEANTSYTYRIKAFNFSGASSYTEEAMATTPQSDNLAAPSNLKVNIDKGMMRLTWKDNSQNESAFHIQLKKEGQSFTDYAEVKPNKTSYTIPVKETNTKYSFRVRAHNQFEKSSFSNTASITSGTERGYDIEIGYTSTPPAIDGSMEAAWDSAISHPLTLISEGNNSPVGNIGCDFRMLWDNDALYLFGDITDNEIIIIDGIFHYEKDGLELFIDSDNGKHHHYDTNDFHYNFIRETTVLEKQQGAIEGVKKASEITEYGYTMEVKIPWNTLQVSSPSQGHKLGLEIRCIDNDESPGYNRTRENVIAWYTQTNQERRKPSLEYEYFHYATYKTSFYWPYPSEWGTAMLTNVEKPIDSVNLSYDKKHKKLSEPVFSVYPNPAPEGIFTLTINHPVNEAHEIKVFNLTGKKIFSDLFKGNKTIKIDLSDQPDGIYLIKYRNQVKKVVKK